MQGEGAAVGLGLDDIKAHLPPGWEELAIEMSSDFKMEGESLGSDLAY